MSRTPGRPSADLRVYMNKDEQDAQDGLSFILPILSILVLFSSPRPGSPRHEAVAFSTILMSSSVRPYSSYTSASIGRCDNVYEQGWTGCSGWSVIHPAYPVYPC